MFKCEKCGCEDYSTYKDAATGEWIKECQNCSSKAKEEQ